MPEGRESRFLIVGASLATPGPTATLIGRADGDIRVGDVVLDEIDGRVLGTILNITAYRRALTELSSGMTAEVFVQQAEGALPFRVPSSVVVRG